MQLRSLFIPVALLFCAMVSMARAAESDSMRTIVKGAFSGLDEAKQMVVTNQTGWDAVWQKHEAAKFPKEPAPKVNFEKETVLVVAQGRQRTGGYSTEITDVRRGDEKTVVIYHNRTPKPGALSIQALTAPVHIVAVPKIEGKVAFKEE